MRTTKCHICGRDISNANIQKHIKSHSNKNNSQVESLNCQFCNKLCKNTNSLKNHQRLCKANPNRQLTNYEKNGPIEGFNNKGRISNRKGLTKENDESIRKMIETTKLHYEQGLFSYKGHPHSEATKERLRQVALNRNFGGTNKRKTFNYNGVILESSYELIVAKELDSNNIEWSRPHRFFYKDNKGVQHHYTPDFYLPYYNVYLDPKNDYLINQINPHSGFKDIDKIQWVMEQNDIKVIILDKNNLKWTNILHKINAVLV